jgi:2-polyprenyl-6-methoxyphenol hydroxylase-like FAD-dependent oxidoreductase
VIPLLEVLGVRRAVEAVGFPRPYNTRVLWSTPLTQNRHIDGPTGFLVQRTDFDSIIFNAARESGVNIVVGKASIPIRENSSDHLWRIPIQTETGKDEVQARVFVDASGQRGRRISEPLLAIEGIWEGINTTIGSIVEAGVECWYWGAELPSGRYAATIFLDPREPKHNGIRDLESHYCALIKNSKLLQGLLTNGLCSRLRACDASAKASLSPIEQNLIRVGDAAARLDPIASQGVQAALVSSLQATAVINTWLRRPNDAIAASEFYRTRQEERVIYNSRLAASFYFEAACRWQTSFWYTRATPKVAQKIQPLETIKPQIAILENSFVRFSTAI